MKIKSSIIGGVIVILVCAFAGYLIYDRLSQKTEKIVSIEKSSYPEGWQTYSHNDYALAYPADIRVVYDEPFDVLYLYLYQGSENDPVATLFPSRSAEEEIEELKKIDGIQIKRSDVYGDAQRLDRITLTISRKNLQEESLFYIVKSQKSGKSYTLKSAKGVEWADYEKVARTIRTP